MSTSNKKIPALSDQDYMQTDKHGLDKLERVDFATQHHIITTFSKIPKSYHAEVSENYKRIYEKKSPRDANLYFHDLIDCVPRF